MQASSTTPGNQTTKNLAILHFTVFIWGFTGILGQLIQVHSVYLVWYRVLIAALTLGLYFKLFKVSFKVNKAAFFKLVFTGALVGLHWILFFQSIKMATVSVTLVCLSSITLFTAVLEPLIKRKRISRLEILAGTLIIGGIVLIFKFETQYAAGIITGLLSAVCASLFSIINSNLIHQQQAPVIAFYELIGAFFWISLFLLFSNSFNSHMLISPADVGYLLLLGTVCTSLAYVAGVSVMRELSAFRVALITNLEPVYGIIMAFIFFGDQKKLSPGFWLGALIIIGTIFLFPIVRVQRTRLKNKV